MQIASITLLNNVGQFHSVTSGQSLPLGTLVLGYAENGRGKTTLAAILKSAGTGDPTLVTERSRLGSAQPPKVVLKLADGTNAIFDATTWAQPPLKISVFDDGFVSSNVCSGIDVDTDHREGLHDLILGQRGTALVGDLESRRIEAEQRLRDLRAIEGDIPASLRQGLSVDEFCALTPLENADSVVPILRQRVAAVRAQNELRTAPAFVEIDLPPLDLAELSSVLATTLPDIQAVAAEQVQEHLSNLGRGGEQWIADGQQMAENVERLLGHDTCPYCAQNLGASEIVQHYEAYFGEAYRDLRRRISEAIGLVTRRHGGEGIAMFERSMRLVIQASQFWMRFIQLRPFEVDTGAITQSWGAARSALLELLARKAASPLESLEIPSEVRALIEVFENSRRSVMAHNASLASWNQEITRVRASAASDALEPLERELRRAEAAVSRFAEPIATKCREWLAMRAARELAEVNREQARVALNDYRGSIFSAYGPAINQYLVRFNAGFTVAEVRALDSRSGSGCTYKFLINNVMVDLTAATGPSFRNTLSAGDRNALALAFFFASLDKEPDLSRRIVLIDDPMTSLDEHRSMTTVQEIRRLRSRVAQVIVLSHSKPFLCAVWQGEEANVTAIKIGRASQGSSLEAWNVSQECVTEYDRRHELVRRYVASDPGIDPREVATALRPMLEAFLRVVAPEQCVPGTLLGEFINKCRPHVGRTNEIFSAAGLSELVELKDYGNLFHHDTNEAWRSVSINETELLQFCQRTLAFTHA